MRTSLTLTAVATVLIAVLAIRQTNFGLFLVQDQNIFVNSEIVSDPIEFDTPIGGGRHLIVCIDGTWNSPGSLIDANSMGGIKQTAVLTPSNVVKLAFLLGGTTNQYNSNFNSTGMETQKVYYHSGVGTEVKNEDKAQLEAVFGNIEEHLLDAYTWLANEYQPGDEISAIGFSRGATIVRSLFSFIRYSGLANVTSLLPINRTACIQEALDLYKDRDLDIPTSAVPANVAAWKKKHAHPHVSLHFLGVMDTVMALDVPEGYSSIVPSSVITATLEATGAIEYNDYHDLRIGTEVRQAYHALAIDEKRAYFPPTLFERAEGLRNDQVREQRWFRGSHADVGGGWWEAGLSHVVLDWMIEKAREAGLKLKAREEFEKFYTPLLLGISREDFLARNAIVKHDYFEYIGSKDGNSPLGRKIIRTLKDFYMDTEKFAPSLLHDSVFHLLKDEPVPENLIPFLSSSH
ncbi:hypothetical protein BC830DRAFT_665153 [Chytriomyces sp. MP71]|nr:hypothetical protein BC830DRAFT_665153 [Chytriomyces sp. MP71]